MKAKSLISVPLQLIFHNFLVDLNCIYCHSVQQPIRNFNQDNSDARHGTDSIAFNSMIWKSSHVLRQRKFKFADSTICWTSSTNPIVIEIKISFFTFLSPHSIMDKQLLAVHFPKCLGIFSHSKCIQECVELNNLLQSILHHTVQRCWWSILWSVCGF